MTCSCSCREKLETFGGKHLHLAKEAKSTSESLRWRRVNDEIKQIITLNGLSASENVVEWLLSADERRATTGFEDFVDLLSTPQVRKHLGFRA